LEEGGVVCEIDTDVLVEVVVMIVLADSDEWEED
jgi:hypothetical protein